MLSVFPYLTLNMLRNDMSIQNHIYFYSERYAMESMLSYYLTGSARRQKMAVFKISVSKFDK